MYMENKLVVIIPFRNVKNYIEQCAISIINQNYKNWIAIFCDDESTDDSLSSLPKDDRFIIRHNHKRISALPNIHYGIIESSLNDEDIICLLDGDDFLYRNDALNIINDLYQDNTLLTYGQYIWPNGQTGHCIPYTKETFNNLRHGGYLASHMKTFKYKLYKEIMVQDPDLHCYKDKKGEFYNITSDVAIMTPLMEICGFNNIKFNDIPIYGYRVHEQNDVYVAPVLQKSVAEEIFSKQKFKQVF